MIDTFNEYDIDSKVYKASMKELSNCDFPIIITWEKRHYVIVEKIVKDNYYVVDSSIGRIRYVKEEFEKKYSGIVILTQKKESFQNCTKIVVTHNIKTIKKADNIIVMDDGKIVGIGKYDVLASGNDFFQELVTVHSIT